MIAVLAPIVAVLALLILARWNRQAVAALDAKAQKHDEHFREMTKTVLNASMRLHELQRETISTLRFCENRPNNAPITFLPAQAQRPPAVVPSVNGMNGFDPSDPTTYPQAFNL